jgi:hypothetical protein
MEDYEAKLRSYEAAVKERKKSGAEPPAKPARPTLERVTVNDATAEALVPILQENPRGVVLVRDELMGWVQSMNQYREGGKGADQQIWLSAWSGSTVTVDRKKTHELGPLRVRHPFVSVIGGLTPDKLPALRGEKPRQRAELDGFIDRVLLSYPPEPPVAAENWLEISEAAKGEIRDTLNRLRSLKMVRVKDGETGKGWRPFLVQLTPCGRRAWQEFTEAHAAERNADDFPLHLVGPWAKLRGYAARLALIVHMLRQVAGEVQTESVDGESMGRAARLVHYFKSHARKVYTAMEADPRVAEARRVLRCLAVNADLNDFTRRDLYQHLRRHFKQPEALDAPLRLPAEYRYLRCTTPERAGRPGPNPERYEVNSTWDRWPRPQDTQDTQDRPKQGELVDSGDCVYGSDGKGDAWEGD